MSTIYLRNVPDHVAADLAELAAREGMSLNRFLVRELREVARRLRNRELLDALPDHQVPVEETLAAIAEGRFRHDRP